MELILNFDKQSIALTAGKGVACHNALIKAFMRSSRACLQALRARKSNRLLKNSGVSHLVYPCWQARSDQYEQDASLSHS